MYHISGIGELNVDFLHNRETHNYTHTHTHTIRRGILHTNH